MYMEYQHPYIVVEAVVCKQYIRTSMCHVQYQTSIIQYKRPTHALQDLLRTISKKAEEELVIAFVIFGFYIQRNT